MKWKQQIGGILALVGLGVMVGSAGWWFMTRGVVLERAELFSQNRVETGKFGPVTTFLGSAADTEDAWELGPYSLGPEDSPVSITGVFTAFGSLAKERPRLVLTAQLFDGEGNPIWNGESRIDRSNTGSDADVSRTELSLGMVPIAKPDEYMLYCSTKDESFGRTAARSGSMELDLVVRKQAKTFPFIPAGTGFLILLVAVFGFGERVQR